MAIAAQTKNKPQKTVTGSTVYPILLIIGICHMLNDTLQAVIPAMFPILERSMGLTFTQLGLIAFTLNMVSSVMQPAIGWYTDKRPMPYALPIALFSSAVGIFGLAFAPSFATILLCVVFIGLGSAIFHPEGSRVANMAAGPRRGLAQSIYQVGGNTGQAFAPLIAALMLVPLGQPGVAWFTIVGMIAVGFLLYISRWYARKLQTIRAQAKKRLQKQQDLNFTASQRSQHLALSSFLFSRVLGMEMRSRISMRFMRLSNMV